MKVAVVGLGKLGQPMAVVLARAGHDVTAFDLNPAVRSEVAAGRATVDEPMLAEELAALDGSLRVADTVSRCVEAADVTYVIVPTPTVTGGGFTNRYVLDVMVEVGRALRGRNDHHTVVVNSTVMPGSMEAEIIPTLLLHSERPLRDSPEGVSVVYSPQFIALGSVMYDMRNPDVLLVGTSSQLGHDRVRAVAESTWDRDDTHVAWLQPTEAEIVKLGINTYITNKITFANVIGQVCAAIPGVDGYKVCRSIGADSRIGNKYILAGGPYGGTCFPRDTDAFAAFVDEFTGDGRLAQLASSTANINNLVVSRVVRAAVRAANDPSRDSEAAILLLGLGYKPASPVIEESFGLMILDELKRHTTGLGLDFEVCCHDAYVQHPVPIESEVTFLTDPATCAKDPNVVSVICTPEPQYAQLTYSAVVDVWGVVPDDNAELLINYRDGNANHLLSAR